MSVVTCPNCGNSFDAENPKVPGYCEECHRVYDLAFVAPASRTPCCQATMKFGSPKKERVKS